MFLRHPNKHIVWTQTHVLYNGKFILKFVKLQNINYHRQGEMMLR